MLNIILFGPPGAGKGTQSLKLAEKYNLKHLSTGDILRAETAAKSELGLAAKQLMDAGKLVPDEIVIKMIDAIIIKNLSGNGFIFDGFPRTLPQAEALDKLMATHSTTISITLALEVNEPELIQRLILRGKSSGRIDDQNEEIQKKRQLVYKTETSPLKDYYKTQHKLRQVNGMGEIDDIFKALCSEIDKRP